MNIPTTQQQPEITPEQQIEINDKKARESAKYWAGRSAKDLSQHIDLSLFHHG